MSSRVKLTSPHCALSLSRLFTAGDDYLVRLLPTSYTSSADPLLIEDAAAPITWIDAGKDHLVVASEDGSIRVYSHHPEATNQYDPHVDGPTTLVSVLTRTSLPTRCVALEKAVPSGKTPRAAICSDELIIKVIDVGDSRRVHLLTGHARSVRAASWSPTAPVLITSSCDGTARIWDCGTAEPGCTKVLESLPVTKPEDETDIHAEWHPSGQSFVLPSKGNELTIYSASSDQGWIRSGVLTSSARGSSAINAPNGAATALTFSPNGRYLASATTDSQVTIWETSSRTPVRARRAEGNVTGLTWHPSSDALAWTDTNGQLVRWDGVLGSNYASPYEAITFDNQSSARAKSRVEDLFAGIDDDDDDSHRGGAGVEGQDEERRHREEGADGADGLDDFVVDDEDGEYSSALAAERRHKSKQKALQSARYGAFSSLATTKAQPAFQPNSTPMRNSRRFLSLSLFGSLISIDQESHHVVSFESFDTAARRNWKLVDHFGYSMASVGASGALLACPRKGDSKSAVHFKPFEAAGAWSTPGAEWGVEMPLNEEIIAVAMGGAPPKRTGRDHSDEIADAAAALTSTAVIATSNGYLRFFSSSGLQRYIWALGSPVVALAAGKQHALVVHRSQTAMGGFQHLSYILIDLISFQTKQSGTMPLGKDDTLQWVGFNDLDIPTAYDSRGILYLLDRSFAAPGQARWTPALDTTSLSASRDADGDVDEEQQQQQQQRASTSRTKFWPLATSTTQMFCIFVRGAAAFPDPSAHGHPLIQEVDLKVPLVSMDQPGVELEEKHLRQTLLASAIRSAFSSLVVPPTEYASDVPDPAALTHDTDKDLLQLIQLACKSDKHARALDAARELHGSRMLDAALQIAGFFHLTSLADRMDSLREWVETRAERDERLEQEGVEGVSTEEFAEAAARSRRRVLVASSPSPGLPSTSSHARKALAEDFQMPTSATPRRSQHLRGVNDELASSSYHRDSSMPTSSAAMEASASMPPPPVVPRSSSGLLSESSRMNSEHEEGGSDGEDMTSRLARKRKTDEAPQDQNRSFNRQRSSASANAFNKTTLGGDLSSSSSTSTVGKVNRNPFARQPGMIRDRSMHKSNSFFDRAEADLSAPPPAAPAASKAKKTKQATLFGMGGGASSSSSSSSSKDKIRPAFGESQPEEEDSQMSNGDDESMRLTLSNAVADAARRQRTGGLEETQETELDSQLSEIGRGGGEDDNDDDDVEAEVEEDNRCEDASAPAAADGRSKLEAFRRQVPVV